MDTFNRIQALKDTPNPSEELKYLLTMATPEELSEALESLVQYDLDTVSQLIGQEVRFSKTDEIIPVTSTPPDSVSRLLLDVGTLKVTPRFGTCLNCGTFVEGNLSQLCWPGCTGIRDELESESDEDEARNKKSR